VAAGVESGGGGGGGAAQSLAFVVRLSALDRFQRFKPFGFGRVELRLQLGAAFQFGFGVSLVRERVGIAQITIKNLECGARLLDFLLGGFQTVLLLEDIFAAGFGFSEFAATFSSAFAAAAAISARAIACCLFSSGRSAARTSAL
jgi:hypothetical protein